MPSSSLHLPWKDNTTSRAVGFCLVDAVCDGIRTFTTMTFELPEGDRLATRRSPSLALA